jgi:hypothetical protein
MAPSALQAISVSRVTHAATGGCRDGRSREGRSDPRTGRAKSGRAHAQRDEALAKWASFLKTGQVFSGARRAPRRAGATRVRPDVESVEV